MISRLRLMVTVSCQAATTKRSGGWELDTGKEVQKTAH